MQNKSVVVIGMGYVGLPLAISAAKSGFHVTGLDIDSVKIEELNSGNLAVSGISRQDISNLQSLGRLAFTSNYDCILRASIIVVCVPTPLNAAREPDLSFVIDSATAISSRLKVNSLIILESTVAPGTTRNVFAPIVKSHFSESEKSIYVSYSPERIDPDNKEWNISNTPKLVSGMCNKSKKLAIDFYSEFINQIVECNSMEVAEASKLLENSFRLFNISFINEFAVYCNATGIKPLEVISVASTKPYGFMPFYPGLGAGGHCIPVDPLYLSHAADTCGVNLSLLKSAVLVNNEIPNYFVRKVSEIFGDVDKKRILVLGVAYKPNLSDTRESPVEKFVIGLESNGANVKWHDELVKNWRGQTSSPISGDYDLLIIATKHSYINLSKLPKIPLLDLQDLQK
jgi:UDP-N-acetyl-D-glucosamine dehydrogenase